MPLLRPWHRHSRWQTQLIFWACAALTVLLLLTPPAAEIQTALGFTAAAGSLAGWWLLGPGTAWRRDAFPLAAPVLALAGVLALAALLSADPASAWNAFSRDLAAILFFVVVWAAARNVRGVGNGLAWLTVVAALLALYGVYQHFLGLPDTYARTFAGRAPVSGLERAIADRLASGRAFALFAYPNLFAGFLAAVLPLCLALAGAATNLRQRGGWLACALALVCGLAAAGSFGGWLAAAAGVVCLAVLLPAPAVSWRGRLLGLGLGLAVVGVLLVAAGRGPEALVLAVQQRWTDWLGAWRMAAAHPLLGVGPGLFGVYYPAYQTGGEYIRFAHGAPWHALGETGVVGAAAWLVFFTLAVKAVGAAWPLRFPGRRGWLLAGLAAGVAAFGLHAAADVDFNFSKNTVFFWLCLGALLGLASPRRAPEPKARAEAAVIPGQWLQTGLMALLLLVLWHGGRSLWVEGLLAAGAAALVAWRWSITTGSREAGWWRELPLVLPLGALFVWAVIAAGLSPHPAAAVPGLNLAVAGLMLFGLALSLPGMDRWLFRVLPVSALVLAAAALFESKFQPGLRAASGWPNPNLLAAYLAAGLLTLLAGWLGGRFSVCWRVVTGAVAVVVFAGLLATGSFGGLLNLLAGLALLAVWMWRRQPRRGWAVLLLAGALGGLAAWTPLPTGRRLAHWAEYSGQAYERLHLASAAWRAALDRPYAGWGPGNFEAAFNRVSFPNVRGLARYGMRTAFAHNEPLQVLVVLGVPGFLLLLWLLWEIGRHWRRQWRASPQEPPGIGPAARAAAWSVLAGAGAQGLVDFNWHAPALLAWGVCWLGAVLAKEDRAPLPAAAYPGRGTWDVLRRGSFTVIWLLAACWAAWAARPLWAKYWLETGEAQRYKKNLTAAAQDFERAISAAPWFADAYDSLGQTQLDFLAATRDPVWGARAVSAVRTAARLNRLDAFVHRHLGQAYALQAVQSTGPERTGLLQQALAEYRTAQDLAPHQAFLAFELGNLQREAGFLSAAEASWRRAIELEPVYAAAWSNLGVALELRGDPAAEAAYRRALAIQPLAPAAQGKYELDLVSLNWAVVHFNLAHLLEHEGRWREARAEYALVLAAEPGNELARRRFNLLEKIAP
jgi:tetratricopeptide (TPR) repeat protein